MADLAEAYSYEKDFDSIEYVSNYLANIYDNNGEGGRLKFSLDCLHDSFKNGEFKGTMLDIGTGPTVHTVISASRHVTEIHLSDLVERNRDVLQKWLDGESNAIQSFQYIMEMEQDGRTCTITDPTEAYSYEKDFDSIWYLHNYATDIYDDNGKGGRLKFSLDCLHDSFKNGEIRGTLLDIGTGPTVHSVISASRHVTEIHLSDLVDRNRDILQKWLDGESNAVPSFQYIMEMEQDGSPLEDRISMARDKVAKIYPLDLRVSDPLPDSKNKYDVIIASLSFAAMTKNKQDFKDIVKKVAAMLKPTGHLLIIDVIKGTYYTVGNVIFGNPNLRRDAIMEALMEARLKLTVWKEMTKEGYTSNEDGTDIEDFYFACCCKS